MLGTLRGCSPVMSPNKQWKERLYFSCHHIISFLNSSELHLLGNYALTHHLKCNAFPYITVKCDTYTFLKNQQWPWISIFHPLLVFQPLWVLATFFVPCDTFATNTIIPYHLWCISNTASSKKSERNQSFPYLLPPVTSSLPLSLFLMNITEFSLCELPV